MDSVKSIFENIYVNNVWDGPESRSGTGSSLDQTQNIRGWLPKIIEQYQITSMLDVPCGDYWWMPQVDLKAVRYEGWDIVDDIITHNSQKYKNVTFRVNNIIETVPYGFDLILCRDLLSHLCFNDALCALNNFKNSGAKYLMANTYGTSDVNIDIVTGKWLPINLLKSPYNLPPYLDCIADCANGISDKQIAIWKL